MSTAVQNIAALARNGSVQKRDEVLEPAPALTPQQRETAQYVADMILELRNMAKAARLLTVTVPLEYAYYEAFSMANQVIPPQEEIDRLRELSRAAVEAETAVSEDY